MRPPLSASLTFALSKQQSFFCLKKKKEAISKQTFANFLDNVAKLAKFGLCEGLDDVRRRERLAVLLPCNVICPAAKMVIKLKMSGTKKSKIEGGLTHRAAM